MTDIPVIDTSPVRSLVKSPLIAELAKRIASQAEIIATEAAAALDERDAQSLLLDRIQYYVNMGLEHDSQSNVSHALGHIAQELKEYAKHHLLGKFPPCVVQQYNDEVFLRDGTRVSLRRAGTDAEFPEAGLVVWSVPEFPKVGEDA